MLNTRLDIYCANIMIVMIKEQKTEEKKVEVMRVFTMRMKNETPEPTGRCENDGGCFRVRQY